MSESNKIQKASSITSVERLEEMIKHLIEDSNMPGLIKDTFRGQASHHLHNVMLGLTLQS